MKILVFAPFFPPDPTGSSVFAGQQVRELVRLGHEVLVVTNEVDKNAPTSDETDDIESYYGPDEVHRLRSIRVNLGKITWNYGIPVSIFGFAKLSFKKKLKEFEADLVIIHSTLFDLSLLALLWSSRNNKNVIVVSHTALWHDNRLVNLMMRLYGRVLLKRLVAKAKAKIVCVDKWTLENACGLFGNTNEVLTIPVSVELGKMKDGNAEKILQRHKISDGPIVLSLGHVVPLRDRINLIRALPRLVKAFPDLKVIVVGMVKDSRFLQLASQLEVLDHLVLAGPVPHSEIKDYLAAATVETHDLDGRGLGITSVEAMDADVPIVAWAIDDNYPRFSLRGFGPSGFINDGKPETIADAISRMILDYEYRKQTTESQRKLVNEVYSVESITRQYLEIVF